MINTKYVFKIWNKGIDTGGDTDTGGVEETSGDNETGDNETSGDKKPEEEAADVEAAKDEEKLKQLDTNLDYLLINALEYCNNENYKILEDILQKIKNNDPYNEIECQYGFIHFLKKIKKDDYNKNIYINDISDSINKILDNPTKI